jgi:transposase
MPHRLGRSRRRDLRTIVDAILYLLWTSCQWRALPREFPRVRRFNASVIIPVYNRA